jgi:hypothetical protein
MPTPESSDEQKLEKFSKLIERGWAKAHPVSGKIKEAVRSAIREQHLHPERDPGGIDRTRQQGDGRDRDAGPDLSDRR